MDYNISTLDFSEIPERCFIKAILVRDIAKARPLTKEEKASVQRGGPDIFIEPVIGKSCLMYRADVLGAYTYTNGKKINIKGWKSNKLYVIFKATNVEVAIMQVPLNNIVKIGNKYANNGNKQSGDYIVCLLDAEGNVDRESASVVTSAVFRKICYIPPQKIISRHAGANSKFFDLKSGGAFSNKMDIHNKQIKQVRKMNAPTNINNLNTGRNDQNQSNNFGAGFNRQNKQQNPALRQAIESNNTYTVVAQLLDDMGKRVGFTIQAKNGETRKINFVTARNLCEKKKLDNMTIVSNDNNSKYFRGIGMKLEDLPIDYVY